VLYVCACVQELVEHQSCPNGIFYSVIFDIRISGACGQAVTTITHRGYT
jgi:hypothetical protein